MSFDQHVAETIDILGVDDVVDRVEQTHPVLAVKFFDQIDGRLVGSRAEFHPAGIQSAERAMVFLAPPASPRRLEGQEHRVFGFRSVYVGRTGSRVVEPQLGAAAEEIVIVGSGQRIHASGISGPLLGLLQRGRIPACQNAWQMINGLRAQQRAEQLRHERIALAIDDNVDTGKRFQEDGADRSFDIGASEDDDRVGIVALYLHCQCQRRHILLKRGGKADDVVGRQAACRLAHELRRDLIAKPEQSPFGHTRGLFNPFHEIRYA